MFGDVVGCTVGVMLVTHGVGRRCRWSGGDVDVGLVFGEFSFEFTLSSYRRVVTHMMGWVNAWGACVRCAYCVDTHAPNLV